MICLLLTNPAASGCVCAAAPARRLSPRAPLVRTGTIRAPQRCLRSPFVSPSARRRLQASHPEQHQCLQVVSEHRHRGAERTLQQAVRPLQVVPVPQDENRVEVQCVPGPVSDSGEWGLASGRRGGGLGGRWRPAQGTGDRGPQGEKPRQPGAPAAPSAVLEGGCFTPPRGRTASGRPLCAS